MIDTETITRWLHYNALSAAEAVRVLELSGYPLGDAIAIVGDAVLGGVMTDEQYALEQQETALSEQMMPECEEMAEDLG